MCLTIDKKRHHQRETGEFTKNRPKEFVADRPLIIMKRVRFRRIDAVRKQYRSPYYDTLIRLKQLYKCTMNVRFSEYNSEVYRSVVERGFHGFLMSATVSDWYNRPTLLKSNITTIYGVIPVGAKYYIGCNKEVVSNEVMYFETLQDIANHYNVEKLADPHFGGYTDSTE